MLAHLKSQTYSDLEPNIARGGGMARHLRNLDGGLSLCLSARGGGNNPHLCLSGWPQHIFKISLLQMRKKRWTFDKEIVAKYLIYLLKHI